MRTYAKTRGDKLKPNHHISITQEVRLDMEVWHMFLQHPSIFCRPFIEFQGIFAHEINLYTNAAKADGKGFGAICGSSWMLSMWSPGYIHSYDPSIEYLELFSVTAAVHTWIKHFRNQRIFLFCDNESVVHMINNSSSTCKNCMVLIRLITLESLIQNVRVYAKHIRSKDNGPSDALSRGQLNRFHALCPNMDRTPTDIPNSIWPIEKLWHQS